MDMEMNDRACSQVAEFFGILANATRMKIFCGLVDHRRTVSELADHAGVSIQNVSQHLRVMRDKGSVRSEKEGQHVYYSVVDERYVRACELVREALLDDLRRRAGTASVDLLGRPSETSPDANTEAVGHSPATDAAIKQEEV